MDGNQGLEEAFKLHDAAVRAALTKAEASDNSLGARLTEIEQRLARSSGAPAGDGQETLGAQVCRDEQIKSLSSNWKGRVRVGIKAIITTATTAAPGSAGALLVADRQAGIIELPRRPLRLRALFAQGQTSANAVEWAQQTLRTNRAAAVAEGQLKPESDYQFALKSWPVRVIAHWVQASKQILDDVPMLESIINSELVWGLQDAEEMQLLNGGGTGADLLGILPGATAYSEPFDLGPLAQQIDVLLAAAAQCEALGYQADGIALHPTDWRAIQSLKAAEGRYLASNPLGGDQAQRLWNLPLATSDSIAPGAFLVGAFQQGAMVVSRQEATIEVSTEDRDVFIRNLVTIRGEQREAFILKYPEAFIKGTFAAALA